MYLLHELMCRFFISPICESVTATFGSTVCMTLSGQLRIPRGRLWFWNFTPCKIGNLEIRYKIAIFIRGRPEISTFSTYEITPHKRGEGVAKNVDNLITFVQQIHEWEKCTNLCKNICHHMGWFAILRSIEVDSPNWLRQITLPWKM